MANPRIDQLKKLVQMDPNDDVALFGLGKFLMEEGSFVEAAQYLEQCVKVKPDYSAAYLALAESLLKVDKKDRAREVCQQGHAVSLKKGDLQVTKKIEALQATLG